MVWCGWLVLVVQVTFWTSRGEAFSLTWQQQDKPGDSRPMPVPVQAKRGSCRGFPCVFSHLGSKTSDATIERIKMSILMDCLNDPHCFTQGRRKRIPPSAVAKQKLQFGKHLADYIRDPAWESLGQTLQNRKRK